MEADWAKLSSRSSASTASDWAKQRTDPTSCNAATDSGTATGWAALARTDHSTAWAGLGTGGPIDDSDDTDDDGTLEAQNVNATSVLVAKDVIGNLLSQITAKTTKSQLDAIQRGIVNIAKQSDVTNIGIALELFETFMGTISDVGLREDKILQYLDPQDVDGFVNDQLETPDSTVPKPLESHIAEARRTGCDIALLRGKRETMAPLAIALQRQYADTFLQQVCDKVEGMNGVCQTYFEKHRGDETPYAKVAASDPIGVSKESVEQLQDACKDDALVPLDEQVKTTNEEAPIRSHTTAQNLKVYRADLEIGALFTLPQRPLLLTFKLVVPLSRTDRCTGKCYRELHGRTCNVLDARKRFRRNQRLHTSDGDGAENLAEKAIAIDLADDPLYPVGTLRAQCQQHKIYHTLKHGMDLFANFITGQIRLALSLRGAGNFKSFKELAYTFLLAHHCWNDNEALRPTAEANAHRRQIWSIFFPVRNGKHQRRNRLKFFIVTHLPNCDIRVPNTFAHFCTGPNCCKDRRDFLRKLKWFIHVVFGRLCRIFPRTRFTGHDDAVDWVGAATCIHQLLPTIYRLWYQKVTGRTLKPDFESSVEFHGVAAKSVDIISDEPGEKMLPQPMPTNTMKQTTTPTQTTIPTHPPKRTKQQRRKNTTALSD